MDIELETQHEMKRTMSVAAGPAAASAITATEAAPETTAKKNRPMYNVIDASIYDRFFNESWRGLPTAHIYNAQLGNVQTLRVESLADVHGVEESIRLFGDERVRKMVKMILFWSVYFGTPLEYLWSTELDLEDSIHFESLEQHVDRLRTKFLGDMRAKYKGFDERAVLDERQKVAVYINQTSIDVDWPIFGFRHCY